MGKIKSLLHHPTRYGCHRHIMPQSLLQLTLRPQPAQQWSVILLAGSRPKGDPLAHHFGLPTKALVPVAGRPMISHVLDNLLAVEAVASVTVLAQDCGPIAAHPRLSVTLADERITTAQSSDGIACSIAALIEERKLEWPILITTADHPLLSTAMIVHFLAASVDCDLSVGLVSRQVAERVTDPSKRTWLLFRDDAVSGANLFALKSDAVLPALRYWSSLERHRKRPWRMAAKLGPILLLQVILRQLTLDSAFAKAGERLGVKARAIRLPFPYAAVDVDKIADHAEVDAVLSSRKS